MKDVRHRHLQWLCRDQIDTHSGAECEVDLPSKILVDDGRRVYSPTGLFFAFENI